MAIAAPPNQDSVIEIDERVKERRNPFYMSKAWLIWILQSLLPRIDQAPIVLLSNYELTNQGAAIGTTALPLGQLAAGVYEVEYFARKTTIDGAASSLTVSLGWTDAAPDSRSLSLSGAAMASDTLTTPQNGRIRVNILQNTALTFTTAYTSTTPGNMRYKLQFTVKQIPAQA